MEARRKKDAFKTSFKMKDQVFIIILFKLNHVYIDVRYQFKWLKTNIRLIKI